MRGDSWLGEEGLAREGILHVRWGMLDGDTALLQEKGALVEEGGMDWAGYTD